MVSDETKEKALEKLDALDKQILYPDDWSPYFIDGLDFKGPEDGGELYEALKEMYEKFSEQAAEIIKNFSITGKVGFDIDFHWWTDGNNDLDRIVFDVATRVDLIWFFI